MIRYIAWDRVSMRQRARDSASESATARRPLPLAKWQSSPFLASSAVLLTRRSVGHNVILGKLSATDQQQLTQHRLLARLPAYCSHKSPQPDE